MSKVAVLNKLQKMSDRIDDDVERLSQDLRTEMMKYINYLEENLAHKPELLKEMRASCHDHLERTLHLYQTTKRVVQEELVDTIDRINQDKRFED